MDEKDKDYLRGLSLREALIKSFEEMDERELFWVEPSEDLTDRIMERCSETIKQEKHKAKMENSFLYRTYHNTVDYLRRLLD